MYQLSRLIRGKGQVARADHHGDQEVSKHRRDGGNQEEEHHDDAVHGEELVVGARLEDGAVGLNQVKAHQHGRDAAQRKNTVIESK